MSKSKIKRLIILGIITVICMVGASAYALNCNGGRLVYPMNFKEYHFMAKDLPMIGAMVIVLLYVIYLAVSLVQYSLLERRNLKGKRPGKTRRVNPKLAAPAAGETPEAAGPYAPLMKAVEKGLKGEAAARTRALLEEKEPLELVDEALIPALDIVGAKYEKGTLFLPQLLQAATAAQGAFEEIKTAIAQKGEGSASKGRIVIATVKGDVHDIGKNIVRVILENYGFEVIDLGRDVPVETVVNTVREKDVHLVGLSALMTTTLKSMEETIRALHDAKLDCKIMVGGAVLTPEYAKKIGADWYAKDAKQSADIAKEFFGV